MKSQIFKMAFCLMGIALSFNSTYSEENKTEETQTLQAGTKKLDAEQHMALKQKRAEQAKEDERGELVTNGMYLTTHPMASHGIYKASAFFDTVELNDGSIWKVWFASDWDVIRRWMYFNDQVIICPGTIFDATDYLLVSQRTGEVVAVNLAELEVLPYDPYFMGQRLWISSIQYVSSLFGGYYEIQLNDGSIWEVSSRDHVFCSLMYPGDIVFIGVDETLGSPTYNVLIHFNSLEYVHADCVAR